MIRRSKLEERLAVGPAIIRRIVKRLAAISSLLLSFSALAALLSAQQEIPRLRVTSYSVVVDVVVTDKRNRHLTELVSEDFEILEDGVVQEIGSVRFVNGEAGQPEEPSAPVAANPTEPAPIALSESSPEPHLIVVLLDYATVQFQNQYYVREAAVEYVRESLRPADLMAVFEVGMSLRFTQGFTNNREALARALSRGNPSGSLFAADHAQLASSAENVEDEVELLTASLDAIAASPNRGGGFSTLLVEMLNNQMERAQAAQGTYRAQLSYSREQQSRPVIGALRTIADGLAHISGRKSLILISEGFTVPLTLERSLYQAVEHAGRSNLAIYCIDAAGLAVKPRSVESELFDISAGRSGDRVKAYGGLSQFDHAREIGSDRKDSTLRFLASETGGLLIRHTNDFRKAFERVDRDLRSHYLLTYTPQNLDFKGEFRRLEVKVNRRGVRVRSRPGYWAVPSGASVLSADEYQMLAGATQPQSDAGSLDLFVQPSHFLREDGDYQVFLTMEIPASALQKQSQDDREFMHLHLVGLVQDRWGNVVQSLRGPSRILAQPGASFLRLDSQIQLSPGAYSLSVHAEDPVSGRSQFLQRSLRLPDPGQKTALSSLVLGEALRPANGLRDYFSVDEVRVLPTARRRFRDGDRVIYLLNVQRPGLDEHQEANLELKISLHHRGRRVHAFEEMLQPGTTVDQSVPRVPIARTLELKGLRPGRYLLRAEIFDHIRSQRLQTQTVFDIER